MNILELYDPQLVSILKAGGAACIPTDTVYGLVTCVTNQAAVRRMLALKGREFRPGTVIAASVDQIAQLGVPLELLEPLRAVWPAPLSVVLNVPTTLHYLADYLPTFVVRVPNDNNLITLLHKTGPLMTSSANLTGQTVASSIKEAQSIFGDKVSAYVNGGTLAGHAPSTIARLSGGKIQVLRQGAYIVKNDYN